MFAKISSFRPGFTQTEDDKGNVSDYHIWNPSGAHAQYYPEDFFAIGIAAPTLVEPGVAAIAPGTFSGQSDTEGNPSHSLNPVPLPWALQIPISEEHTGIKYPPLPPLLTDYSPPSPFNDETITSEVTLPWFAVRDPDLNSVSQLVLSPEYTLIRTVAFKLLQWSHNRTEVTQEIQWSFTEGVFHSRKDEFNWTTKVDIGGEWGVKDALQFKVNISQSFSYTLESVWGWDKSTTFTIPVKIPPGRAVVAYQLQSHYRLIRKDGTQLSVTVPFGRDTIIFDQYPSAQNSDGSKTDRIILKDAFSRAE